MGKLGDELQELIDRKEYHEPERPSWKSYLAFAAFCVLWYLLMDWVFH